MSKVIILETKNKLYSELKRIHVTLFHFDSLIVEVVSQRLKWYTDLCNCSDFCGDRYWRFITLHSTINSTQT
jgi:hypothetical protein